MTAPPSSPSLSGSMSESHLKLLRQARSRFAAIVYAGRLHSVHVSDNTITNLFNIALPRVKALKELDSGPVYTPLQILVLINTGSQTILYEKWDIVLEQVLYGPSVTPPILNRRLLALMRAVMGYMRALPAFRLYYDYKAKFQAEGRDLFELRLIQQPAGTNPFDSGETKTFAFTPITSEAGNLRVSVTWALNPTPTLSSLPFPSSLSLSTSGRGSSGKSTPMVLSTPVHIPPTSRQEGIPVGVPSPSDLVQDDYRTFHVHRRISSPNSSTPYKEPAVTHLSPRTPPHTGHIRGHSETPLPTRSLVLDIPHAGMKDGSPKDDRGSTGRSLPMDIPRELRSSPRSNFQSMSKSPEFKGAIQDVGMVAVIRQRRESNSAGTSIAIQGSRVSSGAPGKAHVGSPGASSGDPDEFTRGTPKTSSFDSMIKNRDSLRQGPSPPKPQTPFRPALSTSPHLSGLSVPSSPTQGLLSYFVTLPDVPTPIQRSAIVRSLSGGSTSTASVSTSVDVNNSKIEEASEEDEGDEPPVFSLEMHPSHSVTNDSTIRSTSSAQSRLTEEEEGDDCNDLNALVADDDLPLPQ